MLILLLLLFSLVRKQCDMVVLVYEYEIRNMEISIRFFLKPLEAPIQSELIAVVVGFSGIVKLDQGR